MRRMSRRRAGRPDKGGEQMHRDERSTEGTHDFDFGIGSGIVEVKRSNKGGWTSIRSSRGWLVE